jgi:hypothetical protein
VPPRFMPNYTRDTLPFRFTVFVKPLLLGSLGFIISLDLATLLMC